ncbi:MAG: hypothetical protein V4725_09815 [Bacteroidota bacterium]|nr:hypothetical protein [Ferruginibacter sp.]
MIELIALYFLCKINGRLAAQKGLKPLTWKIYTIFAWIVAEVIGVILGLVLFGKDNLGSLAAIGLVSAFGGYLFIRYVLDKKPDVVNDDLPRTGIDDLRPPRRTS